MDELTEDMPDARHAPPREDLDAFVVGVVQRDAASLLRLARRHSLCADDAEDAYQRGLEIFIRHAARLDPDRAPGWLRTVVKHEAMAVRDNRQRDLDSNEIDFDRFEADHSRSPEDQAIGFEHVARSAEALQRLKPQEVRALWLRAQGNSYEEIQAETGWTRTKVNRCLYEGRRAFLERYAGIESGEECERWEPLLSALVDGEASDAEMLELRPHLRSCGSCRAVVRELHRSTAPLAAVFPVAIIATVGENLDTAGNVFIRSFEAVGNWASERSASTLVRAQIVTESLAASAGKATAVVAAGAAALSGGAVALNSGAQVDGPSGRAALVATSVKSQRSAAHRDNRSTRHRKVHRQSTAHTPAVSVQDQPEPTVQASAPATVPTPVPQASPPSSASAEMGLE